MGLRKRPFLENPSVAIQDISRASENEHDFGDKSHNICNFSGGWIIDESVPKCVDISERTNGGYSITSELEK